MLVPHDISQWLSSADMTWGVTGLKSSSSEWNPDTWSTLPLHIWFCDQVNHYTFITWFKRLTMATLNYCISFLEHWAYNWTLDNSLSLDINFVRSSTNNNGDIMPHYFLPGYLGGRWGIWLQFDTKTSPIHGEFDWLPYACTEVGTLTV